MNIDKQIKKTLRDIGIVIPDVYQNLLVSQIKQSILKAIMEKLPARRKEMKFGLETIENDLISEFESVIKKTLGEPKQKKVKGVFVPYNPNNY